LLVSLFYFVERHTRPRTNLQLQKSQKTREERARQVTRDGRRKDRSAGERGEIEEGKGRQREERKKQGGLYLSFQRVMLWSFV